MKKSLSPPSYEQLIREIFSAAEQPLLVDELVAQLLERRPANTQNPRKAMLAYIRQADGRWLTRLGADQIVPLHLAFQGVRFRIRLDARAVEKAALCGETLLLSFLPEGLSARQARFVDVSGRTLRCQYDTGVSFFHRPSRGETRPETMLVLKDWFRAQRISEHDHVTVAVQDWKRSVFCLEHEPASSINPELLAQRNRLLGDIFFDLLESQLQNEKILTRVAVPKAYMHLPDRPGYPPDHWMTVLQADPRMRLEGGSIYYAERRAADAEVEMPAPAGPVSRAAGEQVYRFSVEREEKPKRRLTIEIQGQNTLGELDQCLREFLGYERGFHLSAFWRVIQRGSATSTRFREVELGKMGPGVSGRFAQASLVSLGLQPGDRLKYVYDLSDEYEHRLTLQSIAIPKPGLKYPRKLAKGQV